MKNLLNLIFITVLLFVLSGCLANSKSVIVSSANQVELRSFQTRSYDNVDKKELLRAIVSTLQDLSFVVDETNYDFWTVSATKLDGYVLKVSISLKDVGNKKQQVRVNFQYGLTPIEDAKPYQDFFNSLDKGLFLDKNI